MSEPDLTVAQVAQLKKVSIQAVRDVLRNPTRRAQIFPGAYRTGDQQTSNRRSEWRIKRQEAESWQPKG